MLLDLRSLFEAVAAPLLGRIRRRRRYRPPVRGQGLAVLPAVEAAARGTLAFRGRGGVAVPALPVTAVGHSWTREHRARLMEEDELIILFMMHDMF